MWSICTVITRLQLTCFIEGIDLKKKRYIQKISLFYLHYPNGLFCEIGNDIFELIILQYGDFSWNKCNIFSIRFRLLHNFHLVSRSGRVSFLPSELTGNLHGQKPFIIIWSHPLRDCSLREMASPRVEVGSPHASVGLTSSWEESSQHCPRSPPYGGLWWSTKETSSYNYTVRLWSPHDITPAPQVTQSHSQHLK